MADGWRRLLEEESEHQWLTLSLFALFVALGAFAIEATEHFVGDTVVNDDASHQGGLVTHIEYNPDGEGYGVGLRSKRGLSSVHRARRRIALKCTARKAPTWAPK